MTAKERAAGPKASAPAGAAKPRAKRSPSPPRSQRVVANRVDQWGSLPTGIPESVRGPLQAMARLTGVERVARAMERFALSADRAASILNKLDTQRLERLLAAADRAAAVLEGIDAKRIDELASAAERAAHMLERIDEEIGVDRAASVLDGLRSLADTADQMNRSLRAIEQLATEMRRLVVSPLTRLPIPGRRRPA